MLTFINKHLNAQPKKRTTAENYFFNSLTLAERELYSSRSPDQKEQLAAVSLQDRGMYLHILSLPTLYKTASLTGQELSALNDIYNDICDKDGLKQFLGAEFPYIKQLVDQPKPLRKEEIFLPSKRMKAQRSVVEAESPSRRLLNFDDEITAQQVLDEANGSVGYITRKVSNLTLL